MAKYFAWLIEADKNRRRTDELTEADKNQNWQYGCEWAEKI